MTHIAETHSACEDAHATQHRESDFSAFEHAQKQRQAREGSNAWLYRDRDDGGSAQHTPRCRAHTVAPDDRCIIYQHRTLPHVPR